MITVTDVMAEGFLCQIRSSKDNKTSLVLGRTIGPQQGISPPLWLPGTSDPTNNLHIHTTYVVIYVL